MKEFENIPGYVKDYGKACYIIDGFLYDEMNGKLKELCTECGESFFSVRFEGECCQQEIDRVCEEAEKQGIRIFVGIGGGKTLDTAKLCADHMGMPLFIVPSSASTDAPVSEIAVLYTKDGKYIGSKKVRKNAELVIVDSGIIVKAPKRLFIAGIADALATCFEAEICEKTGAPNYIGAGYRACKAGMAIAKCCEEIILNDSKKALEALESGEVSEAFENVVEANILLSGLGFLNTGLAAAHGIHSGLTVLPETHKYLHGEKVSFGIVCQLVLEEMEETALNRILTFMADIGLPMTLEELGVESTGEKIEAIAEKTAEGLLVHHEEKKITPDYLCEVIKKADMLGRKYKNKQ